MSIVVFSASGVLYPAHLGAAHFLLKKGIVQRCNIEWAGTSGGALVASLLAAGYDPFEAKEICKKFLPKDLIKYNWKFWQPPRCMGLFNLNKLEKLLRKFLPHSFSSLKYPLTITTTDLDSDPPYPRYFSCIETPTIDVAKAVIASASIPGIFIPQEIEGHLLADGGLCDYLSTERFGDKKRVISIQTISTIGRRNLPIKTRTDYLTSIADSLLYEIPPSNEYIKIHLPFNSLDFFNLNKEIIDKLFDIGYKTTEKYYEGK